MVLMAVVKDQNALWSMKVQFVSAIVTVIIPTVLINVVVMSSQMVATVSYVLAYIFIDFIRYLYISKAQTCSQKGINACCTSSNRTECGVQISQSTTCYCDSSCVASGDCCSDAVQICAQTQGKVYFNKCWQDCMRIAEKMIRYSY